MSEKLLNEAVVGQVRQMFEQLQHPVEVLFFGAEAGCDYCEDTRQLLEEVVAQSDQLTLSVYDIDKDAELAKQYKIDKAPGIVMAGRDGDRIIDYGVRYAGIPAGHEFASLIQDLVIVSGRDSGLNPKTREYLKNLTQPVHLQVFVTPT